MVAILAYPLYQLIVISFQRYGLFELIRHSGTWVGLDNYRFILHDPVFWDTLVRTIVFTIVNVGLTIALRHADRAAARPDQHLHARAPHRRPDAGLGDAGRRRRAGLVLDDELPERRPQLHAHEARLRRLLPARLVRHPHLAARDGDLADRLGRDPVHRRRRLRGARAGARRARRRRRDRRRPAVAGLPRRHLPDPEADLPDPHEPLDHLGLRRLHAAVPADRRVARETRRTT